MRVTLFIFLALIATRASAAVIYVDATSGAGGNTTLADGSLFSPPLNATTGADNNWEQRTTFGSSGNIFEAGGENAAENAPEIKTTLTTANGLTPGYKYAVYVYFWDPTSNVEDWNIRAGVTSAPGTNTLYSAADASGDLGGSTAALLASTQMFSTAPTTFAESGRALLAASLGTFTAYQGKIEVYIDDLPATTTVNRRTWYDGVGFEFVEIPEPSTVALAGLAIVGLLGLRKRAL